MTTTELHFHRAQQQAFFTACGGDRQRMIEMIFKWGRHLRDYACSCNYNVIASDLLRRLRDWEVDDLGPVDFKLH